MGERGGSERENLLFQVQQEQVEKKEVKALVAEGFLIVGMWRSVKTQRYR